MILTTPTEIGESVREIQAKLGLETEPTFVAVRETAGNLLDDSFANVARKVASSGGSIQPGWTVWEAPGKLIEAEFSAVWISPTGELVDVTPHADGEVTILFIPDPHREPSGKPVENVRLALSDDPLVREMIRVGEELAQLTEKYRDILDRPRGPVAPRVISSATTFASPPDRNAPCPCGSGLKFKRCHGRAA